MASERVTCPPSQPPPAAAVEIAVQLLLDIGALAPGGSGGGDEELTSLGLRLAQARPLMGGRRDY